MSVVMRLERVTLEYPVPRQYRKEDVRPSGVRDISLDVVQGEVLGIVGRNGSGKSTLLHLIAGLISPDKGYIRFQDTVLFDTETKLSPQQRHIGYVRQNPLLFPHMSVLQNLQFAKRCTQNKDASWTIETIIEMFSLYPLMHRAPASLSGGERQRVALARALTAAPKLLLLDEPMASLDDLAAERLLKLLRDIKNHIPMLYVSHNTQRIQYLCDEHFCLQDGVCIPSSLQKE